MRPFQGRQNLGLLYIYKHVTLSGYADDLLRDMSHLSNVFDPEGITCL